MTSADLGKRAAIWFLAIAGILLVSAGCKTQKEGPPRRSAVIAEQQSDRIQLKSPQAQFVLAADGSLHGAFLKNGQALTLEEAEPDSGIRVLSGKIQITDFQRDLDQAEILPAEGKLGTLGKKVVLRSRSRAAELEETLTLELYDDFPNLALLSATYKNSGKQPRSLESVTLQRHSLSASLSDTQAKPHQMWAFFGSSLKWGKDEVLPISVHFAQSNYFGEPVETHDDLGRVGGGIPIVAFWNRNSGIGIGHLETLPLVLSIPARTNASGSVETGVEIPTDVTLAPGESFSTPRTFLTVFQGDFYEPLSLWSRAVDREGLKQPQNHQENYAVSWCGWGYESNVTPRQMLNTIPKLKELGIHWATLDDRWFTAYGDWKPRSDTFGGNGISEMVKEFHNQGIKVQLWWLPLAVEDGRYRYGNHKYVVSEVVREHPDWLILDRAGQPARITRNLASLCPALPEVRSYYQRLTERFIKEWDFDGHKLDNIYATPRCYNRKHHHASPLDSVYAMGEIYKTIFETTRALKTESVTQSCPCGTPPSLAWLRYMDQAVTADPVGSVQVRRRIKMYKGLLGPHAAIYGDHVELTRIDGANTENEQDVGDDFASTLGAGGVLGTKFTWPDYGPALKNVYLNGSKERHWKKWIALYNQKMLSRGTFLNLYVYGYDFPEAYAIAKEDGLYYAFFAPGGDEKSTNNAPWSGEVELRGLAAKTYRVKDYVNDRDFGNVTGPIAKLRVQFSGSLLLEAK
jgi:alpha-galactosidase